MIRINQPVLIHLVLWVPILLGLVIFIFLFIGIILQGMFGQKPQLISFSPLAQVILLANFLYTPYLIIRYQNLKEDYQNLRKAHNQSEADLGMKSLKS